MKSAQKSAKGAPLYSVVVNRPLGRIFAAAAHQLGMTPNGVTAVSAVFTFAGIGLIALGSPTWTSGILIAALLVVGYALDSSDGQLARLRGGGSLLGEWLDHVVDSLKVVSIHLAVLVMAFRHFDTPRWWLLVPLGFAIVTVVHFFGMLLTELLARSIGAPKGGGEASTLMAAAKLPTDYGVLCLSFALLGSEAMFRSVYTVLAVATALYTALVVVRWARRIRDLDDARSSVAAREAVHV
ncbi:CDP-alcohol phosphatidyltransferase family protein [Epidermidibacterium keratini]